MIVDRNLLKEVAKQKKYTFISTGMCTYDDITQAVNIFKNNNCEFELMHCISAYPFDDQLANLNMIKYLKKKYNLENKLKSLSIAFSISFFIFCISFFKSISLVSSNNSS